MAKKKTAAPDSITNTAANRRRAPKKSDAATEQTSAISETFDAGGSMDAADDRDSSSAAVGSGNGASGTHGPSYDEIAQAAYQRYLERGGDHGRDYEDWLEAERELRSRR